MFPNKHVALPAPEGWEWDLQIRTSSKSLYLRRKDGRSYDYFYTTFYGKNVRRASKKVLKDRLNTIRKRQRDEAFRKRVKLG